jgi:hypothetical protein
MPRDPAWRPTKTSSEARVDASSSSIAPASLEEHMSVVSRFVAAIGLIALMGCEQPSVPSSGNAPPVISAPESFRDFGDYVVHFNAITTDQLTPDIARQYGIVRSGNRAMLNVSLLRKDDDSSEGTPVAGSIAASAVNLTGQRRELVFREMREESAVYYIAEFAIANEETLTFTINATPDGEALPLSLRYMRQFYVN